MTTSNGQLITLFFLLLVTGLIVGYDVIVIQRYGVDASISRVCRRLAGRYPVLLIAVVFWLGVLVGHVYLPVE